LSPPPHSFATASASLPAAFLMPAAVFDSAWQSVLVASLPALFRSSQSWSSFDLLCANFADASVMVRSHLIGSA